MNASFHSIFKKAKMRHLFEVKRRLKDSDSTTGFIVDFSDSLVLFHKLDTDTFQLNGYTMIRKEDITKYRVFSKAEYWQVRAVRHFQLKPMRPAGIPVASLPAFAEVCYRALSAYHPSSRTDKTGCLLHRPTCLNDSTHIYNRRFGFKRGVERPTTHEV